ncbi:MAG: PAS domain S-box protein [Pseudomonadales bacterium]|nr:PAS domain S-box protein [Pseudomonadales bacterium]
MTSKFSSLHTQHWSFARLSLLIVALFLGVVEWQMIVGLIPGRHVPTELFFILMFCATLSTSSKWLFHFSLIISSLLGFLWFTDTKFSMGHANNPAWISRLGMVWLFSGITFYLRKTQHHPTSRLRLMDTIGLSSLMLDKALMVVWSNKTWQLLTDTNIKFYEKKRPFLLNIPASDREVLQHHFVNLIPGDTFQFETQLISAYEKIPVQLSVSHLRDNVHAGFEVFCHNLSAMKDTEAELDAKQQLFDQQIASTPLLYVHWSIDARVRSWNQAAEQTLGYTMMQAKNMHLGDFFQPELQQQALKQFQLAVNKHEPITGIAKINHHNGQPLRLRYFINTVTNQSGRLIGIHCFAQDIGDFFHQQKILKVDIEKFSGVFEHYPNGLILLQRNTQHLIEVNPAFLQMLGFSTSDKQSPALKQCCKVLFEYSQFGPASDAPDAPDRFNTQLQKVDNTLLSITAQTVPLKINGQACSLIVIKESGIAEQMEIDQRRLDLQLAKAQTMALIAPLASNIAQRINLLMKDASNITQSLINDMQLDLATDVDNSRAAPLKILSIHQKATQLSDKLLTFSHSGLPAIEKINLLNCINNTLDTAEKTIRAEFKLRFIHPKNYYPVHGDQRLLEQSLLFLCQHLLNLMDLNAELCIQLRETHLDTLACHRIDPDLATGNYISISIWDSDSQIEDCPPQPLMAFFSARGIDADMGLELASVYSTMKSHQGAFTIYFEPDKFVNFRLYLPLNENTVASAANSNLTVSQADKINHSTKVPVHEPL